MVSRAKSLTTSDISKALLVFAWVSHLSWHQEQTCTYTRITETSSGQSGWYSSILCHCYGKLISLSEKFIYIPTWRQHNPTWLLCMISEFHNGSLGSRAVCADSTFHPLTSVALFLRQAQGACWCDRSYKAFTVNETHCSRRAKQSHQSNLQWKYM